MVRGHGEIWNDSHDVKVELVYVPNNEYMDGTKLPTAFASGEGPDLFIISPGDFLRYYNGGVLLDLTPFIEEKAKADFPEGVIANRMVDGKIYGLPMEVEPMAMYYSVAAFEEAGIKRTTSEDVGRAPRDRRRSSPTTNRFGVLFETSARLLPELHLVPFHVAGRRRVPDCRRQERIQLAGDGAGTEVLAGRGQCQCRSAEAARRRRLG